MWGHTLGSRQEIQILTWLFKEFKSWRQDQQKRAVGLPDDVCAVTPSIHSFSQSVSPHRRACAMDAAAVAVLAAIEEVTSGSAISQKKALFSLSSALLAEKNGTRLPPPLSPLCPSAPFRSFLIAFLTTETIYVPYFAPHTLSLANTAHLLLDNTDAVQRLFTLGTQVGVGGANSQTYALRCLCAFASHASVRESISQFDEVSRMRTDDILAN
jgi:hypothetical protein